MLTASTTPSAPATSASPFPYPFDKLKPRFVVTVVDQAGLFEVLAEADEGQWMLRSLNGDNLPIMTVEGRHVRGFNLPIHHCFASPNRSEIVALVNGDEYDVTLDNDAEEPMELFQAVYAAELAQFCDLALAAGFTEIELLNGYDAWEGAISGLLAECQNFINQRVPSA